MPERASAHPGTKAPHYAIPDVAQRRPG